MLKPPDCSMRRTAVRSCRHARVRGSRGARRSRPPPRGPRGEPAEARRPATGHGWALEPGRDGRRVQQTKRPRRDLTPIRRRTDNQRCDAGLRRFDCVPRRETPLRSSPPHSVSRRRWKPESHSPWHHGGTTTGIRGTTVPPSTSTGRIPVGPLVPRLRPVGATVVPRPRPFVT